MSFCILSFPFLIGFLLPKADSESMAKFWVEGLKQLTLGKDLPSYALKRRKGICIQGGEFKCHLAQHENK